MHRQLETHIHTNKNHKKIRNKRLFCKKNAQMKHYETITLSSFCVDHLLLGMEPTLKCGLYVQRAKNKDYFFP